MIEFVKNMIENTQDEWLHGSCYININALLTKAKSSDQYKVVGEENITTLPDGRYVVSNTEGEVILFKQKDNLVFILPSKGRETILTNTTSHNAMMIINHFGKIVNGKLSFLKSSLTCYHWQLTPFRLFEVTNTTVEKLSKKVSTPEHFFSLVLGRDLTYLEEQMVNHMFATLPIPK